MYGNEELFDVTGRPVKDGLMHDEEIPAGVRYGMPLLVIATTLLFLASQCYRGCVVIMDLTTNGQQILQVPYVVELSILSLLQGLARGKAWLLVACLGGFSGVLPYAKLATMLYCWLAPTYYLRHDRRQHILDFLDAFGKWSLVDTYVMIVPMLIAPFQFDISSAAPALGGFFEEFGSDLKLNLWVDTTQAFHEFFFATLLSLTTGMIMTSCCRKVRRTGEWAKERTKKQTDANPLTGRYRICNQLRPFGWLPGKIYAHSTTMAVIVALGLVFAGVFLDSVKFALTGLAGNLGDSAIHVWNVIDVAAVGIPTASSAGPNIGVIGVQVIFFFFTFVTVAFYMPTVLVLWACPLTQKEQRYTFISSQVFNALSSLDVFMFTMVFIWLEAEKVANPFAEDFCNALINDLQSLMGPLTCRDIFVVKVWFLPGMWFLVFGAITYSATGYITIIRSRSTIMKKIAKDDGRKLSRSGGPFLRWLTANVSNVRVTIRTTRHGRGSASSGA